MYLRINDLKLFINVKLARVSCIAYSVLNRIECIRLLIVVVSFIAVNFINLEGLVC